MESRQCSTTFIIRVNPFAVRGPLVPDGSFIGLMVRPFVAMLMVAVMSTLPKMVLRCLWGISFAFFELMFDYVDYWFL